MLGPTSTGPRPPERWGLVVTLYCNRQRPGLGPPPPVSGWTLIRGEPVRASGPAAPEMALVYARTGRADLTVPNMAAAGEQPAHCFGAYGQWRPSPLPPGDVRFFLSSGRARFLVKNGRDRSMTLSGAVDAGDDGHLGVHHCVNYLDGSVRPQIRAPPGDRGGGG